MIRIIYIDYNFNEDHYPNKKEYGDTWFTHGWGSLSARKLKVYFPSFDVECWKADSTAKKIEEKTIENVVYKIFPAQKVFKLGLFSHKLLTALKHESKKNTRTIVNCSSFDHLLFYSICLLSGIKRIVVQHHGEAPAKYKIFINKGIKSFLLNIKKILESASLKRTSLLYLLDTEAEKWLAARPGKIKHLTTGVDEELFRPMNKKEARVKLGLDPENDYLLYIGKLNQTKRPDWLIEMYAEIKSQYPKLKLILGGCSESDQYFQKAIAAGAQTHGTIIQKDIHVWLSAANIYFLPSLSENHKFAGIGMLPLQSAFCQTPVIGNTLRCVNKNITNPIGIQTNDLEEMKNACTSILDGSIKFPDLRTEVLKSYSWKTICNKKAEDYLDLIKTD